MSEREIIVTYESEILGSGTFWRGSIHNRSEIRNVVARDLAHRLHDGETGPLSDGMWTVALSPTPENPE